MNLTLKNVPDDVYQILKRTAAEQGRSLNSEAIRALRSFTEEKERLRQMRASRIELERFVKTLPKLPAGSSAKLLRKERDRR